MTLKEIEETKSGDKLVTGWLKEIALQLAMQNETGLVLTDIARSQNLQPQYEKAYTPLETLKGLEPDKCPF